MNFHCDKNKLVNNPQGRCTLRLIYTQFIMGNETQPRYQDQNILQVEGRDKCAHKTARVWKTYTNTYSLVGTSYFIRLMLIISMINKWHTHQVCSILPYPRDHIKHDRYINIPIVIEIYTWNVKTHIMQLIRNLYGKKKW